MSVRASPGLRRDDPGGKSPLAADAEPRDQAAVAVYVVRPHVVEQAAPTTDQLHQTAPGVVVTLVDLQVLGEVVDPFGEDRHLHFGRAGVGLVEPVSAIVAVLSGIRVRGAFFSGADRTRPAGKR